MHQGKRCVLVGHVDTCRNICCSSVGSSVAAPTLNVFFFSEDIFRINTLSAPEDFWNMMRGGRSHGGGAEDREDEGDAAVPR